VNKFLSELRAALEDKTPLPVLLDWVKTEITKLYKEI
jgi:hypothetical protein